jgi:hypothetical protein
MAGLTSGITKNFTAEAAVTKRRIVKLGASDTAVLLGAASTDLLIGVSTEVDAVLGETCDVRLDGIAEVEFGGAITRGSYVTSDATGRAVAAAPGAGVNASVIGMAMVSGVAGDIGSVLLAQGRIQG